MAAVLLTQTKRLRHSAGVKNRSELEAVALASERLGTRAVLTWHARLGRVLVRFRKTERFFETMQPRR